MSAVLDNPPTVKAFKSLQEIMVIPESTPELFYKNSAQYLEQMNQALTTAKSLVYEITDQGRTQAKSDVALIRKYAATTDKIRLSVFRSLTEKAKTWSDGFTGKTKELNAAADSIMSAFSELEQKKLDSIHVRLTNRLTELRHEKGVTIKFQFGDFDELVKLTGTLTDTGALTKKANDYLVALVNANLAEQTKIEARYLTLENRCLKADINPPLTKAHFGTVFYAADELFNAKLEELITCEIERRAEMEARIIKQQEAAKQREIASAVMEAGRKAAEEHKQTVAKEALKVAREILETPKKPEETPASLRATADRIAETAQHADRNADRSQELATATRLRQQADALDAEQQRKVVELPKLNKRTVTITATFSFDNISSRISDQGVCDFFKRQLGDKLVAILGEVRAT